jgi:copper chaperone CopZ
MTLQGLEDELEGVRCIDASYIKQRMEVDFDENRISEQEIRLAVARLGYQIA